MFDSDGNSVGDEDELAKENVRKLLIESDVRTFFLLLHRISCKNIF